MTVECMRECMKDSYRGLAWLQIFLSYAVWMVSVGQIRLNLSVHVACPFTPFSLTESYSNPNKVPFYCLIHPEPGSNTSKLQTTRNRHRHGYLGRVRDEWRPQQPYVVHVRPVTSDSYQKPISHLFPFLIHSTAKISIVLLSGCRIREVFEGYNLQKKEVQVRLNLDGSGIIDSSSENRICLFRFQVDDRDRLGMVLMVLHHLLFELELDLHVIDP